MRDDNGREWPNSHTYSQESWFLRRPIFGICLLCLLYMQIDRISSLLIIPSDKLFPESKKCGHVDEQTTFRLLKFINNKKSTTSWKSGIKKPKTVLQQYLKPSMLKKTANSQSPTHLKRVNKYTIITLRECSLIQMNNTKQAIIRAKNKKNGWNLKKSDSRLSNQRRYRSVERNAAFVLEDAIGGFGDPNAGEIGAKQIQGFGYHREIGFYKSRGLG